MKNKSITFAGTIIADVVKTIDEFPQIGRLAKISSVSRCVGGAVPNTAIDIKKINGNLQVSAIGKIGNDENGKFIVENLNKYGINTSGIIVDDSQPTSFDDVMSMPTGERTFFCSNGANACFQPEEIDIDGLDCEYFHLGYISFLDEFDKADEEYGSCGARLLCQLQKKGIKTSIDVTSNFSENYPKILKSALKYCDNLIVNEIEICKIWNLEGENEDGTPNRDNIFKAMKLAKECGVKNKVIVHCKQLGFLLNEKGEFTIVPSYIVPEAMIKGSVGAGDAFCAACLYGIMNGYDDEKILSFASGAAATNLFSDNSVDGIMDEHGIEEITRKFTRREI